MRGGRGAYNNRQARTSQLLIDKTELKLSPEEYGALHEYYEYVEQSGIELVFCDDSTVQITAMPSVVKCSPQEIVSDVAQRLMNTATDQKGALFDDMLHTMACKSAIKAHDDTDILELQALADRVMNDRTIRFCPHGRPVMNIATAKPTEEEKQGIPHYLMDFLDPHDSFSVADYVKAAHGIIADIAARGKLPIITGGTGLYISSLIDNLSFEETECDYAYRDELRKLAQEKGNGFLLGMLREIDPETAEKLHENNLNRIIRALEVYKTTGKTMSEQQRLSRLAPSPYEPCMIQLDYDRETLYDRINRRVDIMLAEGLVEETRQFIDIDDYPTAAQAIGYKELMPYLKGESELTPCVERLKQETRKYAKRQLTWFRRDNRIHYIKADGEKNFSQIVDEAIDYIGSVRNKSK